MTTRGNLPGSDGSSKNKPERAYGYLARELNARRWVPGDRLPSAADLADEIEVSRPTVLQAFNQLSDEGRLTVRPGRGGVHVNDWADSRATRLAKVRAKPETGVEWIAFLEFAEPGVARRLAVRGLEQQTLAALQTRNEELAATDAADQDRAVRLEHQFHQTLAEAAGSAVIRTLTIVARSWVDGLRDLVDEGTIDPTAVAKGHERLLTAIRAGKGSAAADLAVAHVTPLLDALGELIDAPLPHTEAQFA